MDRQQIKDKLITLKARLTKAQKTLAEFPDFPDDEIQEIREAAEGVVDSIEDDLNQASNELGNATSSIEVAAHEVASAIDALESAVITINDLEQDDQSQPDGNGDDSSAPADDRPVRTKW